MASGIKSLLDQIHRRSLWQTAVAYGAGCWALLGGVDLLEGVVGFPPWVIRGVAVICVGFLPMVLATTFIQRRGIGGPESATGGPEKGLRYWLSWRNLIVVGSGTLALLAAGTSGYMGFRVMGIGPMGTLIAKGVLPDTVRVMVADFDGPDGDPNLGPLISVALKADLSSSGVLRVVHPEDEMPAVLQAMQAPQGASMTDSLARLTAVRAGIPAVAVGEVMKAGGRYLIDLRLVDPDDGATLLHLAEPASSAEDLLGSDDHPGAVGRLSGRLLERVGEGFRTISNRPPLPSVTTVSLDALRLYAEALPMRATDMETSVTLLREAVALDSTFAMAWRFLGMSDRVVGDSAAEAAMTRAYELRDQLSDMERLDVIGTYFLKWNMDSQRCADAFQRLVARYPDHLFGWIDLSQCWFRLGKYEKYREAALRATELKPDGYNPTVNQWEAGLILRDTATAWGALRLAREYGRWVERIPYREGVTAFMAGDREGARRYLQEGLEWAREEGRVGVEASIYVPSLGALDLLEGRLVSYRDRLTQAGDLLAGSATQEFDRAFIAMVDYEILGIPEAATEIWDALHEAQARMGPDAATNLDLAYYFAYYGEPEPARDILEAWEAQTPRGRWPNPETRSVRMEIQGYIALAEGRVEEGLAHLREAVEIGTTLAFPAVDLAAAYDRLNRPDSALVAWQRFVDGPFLPWDRLNAEAFYLPLAYERLGQLYEERGELERAATYYGLFVELWAEADPELQPRVRATREALVRIGGQVQGE